MVKTYDSRGLAPAERAGCRGVVEMMRAEEARLRSLGRLRGAEIRGACAGSLERFLRGADVPCSSFTQALAEGYAAWMSACGLRRNTVHFYLRQARAMFNRLGGDNPFAGVVGAPTDTVRRALSPADLRRVRDAGLAGHPAMERARDIFMLIFYLRGISFADLAALRRDNLDYGVLAYRRRKTGKLLTMMVPRQASELIERLGAEAPGPYLLPLIRRDGNIEHYAARKALAAVNRELRALGRSLDLPLKLTTYVARHTWAQTAKSQSVPLTVISECLGHSSERVTRLYLASLDLETLAEADRRVIAAI